MNSTSNLLRAPLLAGAAIAATAAISTSVALAHNDGKRINRFEGQGAKAASVARHHVGSGKVMGVMKHRSGRVRFEVDMRKGHRDLQLDLSRRFRVLDVHREHAAGDDDPATHDVGDDNGVDPVGHDVGDDNGVDPAGHDVGDDNGVDPAGHDVGDDNGDDGPGHP